MEESNKSKFKPRGGRHKIDKAVALSHQLKFNINDEEYRHLMNAFSSSGVKKMSEYLRNRLIETKGLYLHDPKAILKTLDDLGESVGRIGNNINQLAKYANVLTLKEKEDFEVIAEMNTLLKQYSLERKEMTLAIRALLRK